MEADGCFRAAYAEGLSEALAETSDMRLKDLVKRRILFAHQAIVNGISQPAEPAKPLPELIVTKGGVPFADQAEGIRQFKEACLKVAEPVKVPSAMAARPAASAEPILRVYAADNRVSVTEWMDGARDLPDGDHVLYAAPPEAPESRDDQRWQKARTLPRSWWRDALNRLQNEGVTLDELIDAEMRRKLP